MKREIEIDFGKFGQRTYIVGDLYTVSTWKKQYSFRLVNIKENVAGIHWATLATKTGKMYEVRAAELVPYKPRYKRKMYFRDHKY